MTSRAYSAAKKSGVMCVDVHRCTFDLRRAPPGKQRGSPLRWRRTTDRFHKAQRVGDQGNSRVSFGTSTAPEKPTAVCARLVSVSVAPAKKIQNRTTIKGQSSPQQHEHMPAARRHHQGPDTEIPPLYYVPCVVSVCFLLLLSRSPEAIGRENGSGEENRR